MLPWSHKQPETSRRPERRKFGGGGVSKVYLTISYLSIRYLSATRSSYESWGRSSCQAFVTTTGKESASLNRDLLLNRRKARLHLLACMFIRRIHFELQYPVRTSLWKAKCIPFRHFDIQWTSSCKRHDCISTWQHYDFQLEIQTGNKLYSGRQFDTRV